MIVDGLKRYNEIQKALSAFRRESGIKKFPASFQEIASQIYQSTKGQPLKQVLNNIDHAYKNILPEVSADALKENLFFDYEAALEMLPLGIGIRCPQLTGNNWVETDISYGNLFRDFTNYCNANKGLIWQGSSDAPRFHFENLDFDDIEGIYYLDLKIDREDCYGYVPGMGAFKNAATTASEPKPPIEQLEDEIPQDITKEEKPTKDDFEIRRIEAETEKTKASTAKIAELNKAVENLDKKFDIGIITKAEYKKYYKKLMDM